MIVRKPVTRLDKMHPKYRKYWNKMIQEPEALKYKLQDQPALHADPLGPAEDIPFHIERTHTGNLPVYTEFKCNRKQQLTVVRKISGDVDVSLNKFRNSKKNQPKL